MIRHSRVLSRYAVKRMILVADRGMLSLDQVEALAALKTPHGVELSWIIAVPARRYGEFMDPVVELAHTLAPSTAPSIAETTHGEHRLVVAHDPEVAAAQTAARRATIAEIEAMAQAAADKLDRQDAGALTRGRKASDRGAYLRFVEAVKAAHLSKILKADMTAERFSWQLDSAALARQDVVARNHECADRAGEVVLRQGFLEHVAADPLEVFKCPRALVIRSSRLRAMRKPAEREGPF